MKTTTSIRSLILGMLAVTAIAGTTAIAESIRAFAHQDVALTITSTDLNKDGSVIVKFIVTCSQSAHSPTAIVIVQQSIGKSGSSKQVSGSGYTDTGGYPCEQSGTELSSTIIAATTGFFKEGKATVSIKTFVCDDLGQRCAAGSITKVVQLRR